jgi:parallel beta-helix repeat protein
MGAGTAAQVVAFVLLSVGIGTAACVPPVTIYVRAAGNDTNDGCTPATAVRTIRRGAALATTAGARVVVGPGTYNEGNITPATAAYARISFLGDRRGIEVGEAPGDVVVDATNFSSGFELNHNLATTIDGFVIYGASNGIYVKSQSDQVVISNNVVSNNSGNGVYIQDSQGAWVFNNLVYNNDGTGILVTGNVIGSPGARVVNNTVYRNRNRGIFFAGSTVGSRNGLVINNIVQGNTTAGSTNLVGIQVNAVSRDGYRSAGNLTADRSASGTPTDVTDVSDDPLFVNPDGPDLMLGGAGYLDDDFHLGQRGSGQTMTSPGVNLGSDLSRTLRLNRSTTRTDGRRDGGMVDAGYHYGNFGPLPRHPEARLRYAPLWVSASTGADTNDGRTRATPLQTIARAFQMARPGHRIMLLPGVYREGQLTLANSGLPGRDIVVLAASAARIDATNLQRGILISGRSNITLIGLDIFGASDSGIEIRNASSNITIRRCRLHENGERGLYVNGVSAITMRDDAVERNGSRGVQVNGGQLDIVKSTLSSNEDHGVWAINGSTVNVSSSVLRDNQRSGVLAEQSTVTIADTSISGSQDGGARFTKQSTGTLTRVTVSNNTDVGVQGISSLVNVSDSVVEGSRRVGIEGFVDPVSHGQNQLAITGTHVCAHDGPGVNTQDTALTLTDVTICSNGDDGLRLRNGSAQILRAIVTQNQGAGLTVDGASQLTVQDTAVRNNGDDGVQIVNTAALTMSGSVMSANAGNGLTILDSDAPLVRNNLIYGNVSSGVIISGDTQGSPNAQFLNNTVFGNQNRGLLIGGSNDKPASPGALVLRNIFECNASYGLQVNELSFPGYFADYNLSADRYPDFPPPGAHDVLADALLVGPAGIVLSCTSAPDDGDFHLSQRFAAQPDTSPAVDAGGVDAATAGLAGMTTRIDGVADSGLVDLGYHYRP